MKAPEFIDTARPPAAGDQGRLAMGLTVTTSFLQLTKPAA